VARQINTCEGDELMEAQILSHEDVKLETPRLKAL